MIQDLCSYRKELRDGTSENLISVLDAANQCSTPEATDQAHIVLREAVCGYDEACSRLLSTAWGATAEFAAYTEALRDFTSGVAHSTRYTRPRAAGVRPSGPASEHWMAVTPATPAD